MADAQFQDLTDATRTFEEHRAELVRDHDGEFVVVYRGRIIGFFATLNEALRRGYREFGNVCFLAREISAEDVPISLGRHRLGPPIA